MPSATCSETQGPSNVQRISKRTMSDVEPSPKDSKKARRDSSTEPSTTRRDSNRDTKRRKKKKKKAPVVSMSAGSVKNEATQSTLGERSRAPLSARNEIIRFTSAPSEVDLPASTVPSTIFSSQAPASQLARQSRQGSLVNIADRPGQKMPAISNDNERVVLPDKTAPVPSSGSLEDKVARLEAELNSKNNLIASHQAFLNQVQQAVTCQVCLDLMYKPYALAPCGHLACHGCLVSWFTAPPPDNRLAAPAITRKKTCPHCRAVVRERPVEVWGVKGIAQATGKSGLLSNQLPVAVEPPENLNANVDPWKDIFPKQDASGHRGLPWFFQNADIDDDDAHIADIAPRGEEVGMLDMEDGGIYRCLDCMHEIWDGVCTSCGRVYPGHAHEVDDEDDEADAVGWIEHQMGAEEVDVADDPSWMGLEDGEADDDGDIEDWQPYPHWGHQFHMLRGPFGFLGTIHVDEEDEEEDRDDVYGRIDELGAADADEGAEDDGYESSFIDDDDDDGPIVGYEDGPRIYEVGDHDEDEGLGYDQPPRLVELDSDEGDEYDGYSGVRGQVWPLVVSSDEEEGAVFSRQGSDDAYWSDG